MSLQHVVVYADRDRFAGWPANHGLWRCGNEILGGFARGKYEGARGHDIAPPYDVVQSRSLDGGESWTLEYPSWKMYRENVFLPDRDDEMAIPSSPPVSNRDVIRVAGDYEYAIVGEPETFYRSPDMGRSWEGPYRFTGLSEESAPITSRTNVIQMPEHKLVLMTAIPSGNAYDDRAFVAKLDTGGRWQFLSWIVPPSVPYRAACPSGVIAANGDFVVSVRRKAKRQTWIDLYASDDGSRWAHRSKVADTGGYNGNPPALVSLADGRLVCAYGLRKERKLCAKISKDYGCNWGEEIVLRLAHRTDFGYPQITQRPDGRVVLVYYWSSEEIPRQHIAATIWSVDDA